MKKKLITNANKFVALSVISVSISLILLFIGGLSYSNPQLSFTELYQLEPLKKFIFSIIPAIK